MAYLVEITRTKDTTKIVEKAGVRGARALVSIENEKSKCMMKPRKLDGWSTVKGAEKYIEYDKKFFDEPEWETEYEIIISLL